MPLLWISPFALGLPPPDPRRQEQATAKAKTWLMGRELPQDRAEIGLDASGRVRVASSAPPIAPEAPEREERGERNG
jgi:hypothetical protein